LRRTSQLQLVYSVHYQAFLELFITLQLKSIKENWKKSWCFKVLKGSLFFVFYKSIKRGSFFQLNDNCFHKLISQYHSYTIWIKARESNRNQFKKPKCFFLNKLTMLSSLTNNLLGRFSLKLASTTSSTLFKPFLLLQVRHDSSLDKFYKPRKLKHYPPPKPRDKTARYDAFLKVFLLLIMINTICQ
jgi:hypothetical protein